MTEHGYTVRIRLRAIKKRRRQKGRARGFYEGKYVYLRVTGPDNKVRDIYLGTERESASVGRKPPRAGASSSSSSGGRTEGEKEVPPAALRDGWTHRSWQRLGRLAAKPPRE